MFHYSVCEEEAQEIVDGAYSRPRGGVNFGVGIKEYIARYLPTSEATSVLALVQSMPKPATVVIRAESTD